MFWSGNCLKSSKIPVILPHLWRTSEVWEPGAWLEASTFRWKAPHPPHHPVGSCKLITQYWGWETNHPVSGHGVSLPFLSLLFTQLLLECRTSNVKLREPVYEQGILVAGNKIFSSICNMKQSYSLHVCSDGLTPVVVSKGIIQEILKVDLRSGF